MNYDKEEIYKLAIEAGFHWEYALDEAEEIAALVSIVRAAALEEAAQMCDEEAASWARLNAQDEEGFGAAQCAAAIRGLK